MNITIDFKYAKRVIQHANVMKRRIFKSVELIIFVLTLTAEKEKK